MTTPAAHVPTTATVDLRRVLTYLLAAAGAIALTAAVVLGLQGEAPTTSAEADNVRDWSRTELLDHLARINGYAVTGTAASATPASASTTTATSTSTGTTAPSTDVTQEETLERLYRINGVFPQSAIVPPSVR